MIRTPSHALKNKRWELLATASLFALVFLLPGVAFITAERVHAHADTWLETYEPTVYLSAETTDAQAESLRNEIQGWPSVSEVELRSPAQARAMMEARMSPETVRDLGVSEAMLPTSLLVKPTLPIQGHVELVSKVAGLEARDVVSQVDVPGAQGLKVMQAARSFTAFALLLWAALWCIACVLGFSFLRKIQQEEAREASLLELFGAPKRSLHRPTLIRGAILGAWSGAIASALLLGAQLCIEHWVNTLLGGHAQAPWTWVVVIIPLGMGPLLGVCVGRLATLGLSQKSVSGFPDLRNMLEFSSRHAAPVR